MGNLGNAKPGISEHKIVEISHIFGLILGFYTFWGNSVPNLVLLVLIVNNWQFGTLDFKEQFSDDQKVP